MDPKKKMLTAIELEVKQHFLSFLAYCRSEIDMKVKLNQIEHHIANIEKLDADLSALNQIEDPLVHSETNRLRPPSNYDIELELEAKDRMKRSTLKQPAQAERGLSAKGGVLKRHNRTKKTLWSSF